MSTLDYTLVRGQLDSFVEKLSRMGEFNPSPLLSSADVRQEAEAILVEVCQHPDYQDFSLPELKKMCGAWFRNRILRRKHREKHRGEHAKLSLDVSPDIFKARETPDGGVSSRVIYVDSVLEILQRLSLRAQPVFLMLAFPPQEALDARASEVDRQANRGAYDCTLRNIPLKHDAIRQKLEVSSRTFFRALAEIRREAGQVLLFPTSEYTVQEDPGQDRSTVTNEPGDARRRFSMPNPATEGITLPTLDPQVLSGFAETVGYAPPEGKDLTVKRLFSWASRQEAQKIATFPKPFLKALSEAGIITLAPKKEKSPEPEEAAPAPEKPKKANGGEKSPEPEEAAPAPEKPKKAKKEKASEPEETASPIQRRHPKTEEEMKAKDSCFGKLFEKKNKTCVTCPAIDECKGAFDSASAAKAAKTEPEPLSKSALNKLTQEILELKTGVDQNNAKAYFAIGERMERAFQALPRGEYTDWVKDKIGMGLEVANEFRRCYRVVQNMEEDTLAQLGGMQAVYDFLAKLGGAKLGELADLGSEALGEALQHGLVLPVEGQDPSSWKRVQLGRMTFRQIRVAVRWTKGRNPFESSQSGRGRTPKFQDILKGAKWLAENANRVLGKKVVEGAVLTPADRKEFTRLYRLLSDEYLPAMRKVLSAEGVVFDKNGVIQK